MAHVKLYFASMEHFAAVGTTELAQFLVGFLHMPPTVGLVGECLATHRAGEARADGIDHVTNSWRILQA